MIYTLSSTYAHFTHTHTHTVTLRGQLLTHFDQMQRNMDRVLRQIARKDGNKIGGTGTVTF